MAATERLRDFIAGDLDPDLMERRRNDGWKLVAVEWERSARTAEGDMIDVPYGYRVARDCRHLEEDPHEAEVLRLIMQMVVADRRLSDIAQELNVRGYVTRAATSWRQSDVFLLMPALVNSAPRIFDNREWPAMRRGTA